MWEDEAFVWTMRIRNPGTDDVRVRDFSSSCTCSSIEPRSLVIPAGESRDVRLTLDLTYEGSRPTTEATRDFEVAVKAVLDDTLPRAPEWWAVRGKVRRLMRRDTTRLEFGDTSELAQPLPPREHAINVETPLRRLTANEASGRFRTTVIPADDAGTRFTLRVEPTRRFPVGAWSGEVVLSAVGRDGRALPKRRVLLRGEILDDIQVSPPAVVFGARAIGESVADTFTLTSLTGRKFRVTRIGMSGGKYSADVEPAHAEGKSSHAITVKARFEQEGDVRGEARVAAVVDAGELREIVVPLRYQGVGTATKLP